MKDNMLYILRMEIENVIGVKRIVKTIYFKEEINKIVSKEDFKKSFDYVTTMALGHLYVDSGIEEMGK